VVSDIPECAGLDRRNDSFFAALAGNNDGGTVFNSSPSLASKSSPFIPGTPRRQSRTVGANSVKRASASFRAAYAENLVAPPAQQSFVSNTRVLFILDDQDAVGRSFMVSKRWGQPFNL